PRPARAEQRRTGREGGQDRRGARRSRRHPRRGPQDDRNALSQACASLFGRTRRAIRAYSPAPRASHCRALTRFRAHWITARADAPKPMTHAIQATPSRPRMTRIGLDHVVMAAAVVCLVVLVVLPVGSLVLGSVRGETGLSFENFREALTGRLYVQALQNSLILGAWTGLFSIVIGVPLAWAVARTNVPGNPLIRATAPLPYLPPPFLTAIAFVNLFGPNAGLINKLLRDVLDLPWLTFNIFTMRGLVLVTVLHTFPFVYLLAVSALHS